MFLLAWDIDYTCQGISAFIDAIIIFNSQLKNHMCPRDFCGLLPLSVGGHSKQTPNSQPTTSQLQTHRPHDIKSLDQMHL